MPFTHIPTQPTQPFEGLIDLLRQEEAIYRELGEVLEAEREAMLRLDGERLGDLVARKETLGLRIKALDESRKILARRLGAQFGLPAAAVTLTQLCRRAPAAVAGRLAAIGRSLRQTVTECQAANQANARAASRGLDLVTNAINHLIAQADPAGKEYQASGKRSPGYVTLSKTSGSGLISRRA